MADPNKISDNPYRKFENFYKPLDNPPTKDEFGVVQNYGKDRPYNFEKNYGVIRNGPAEPQNVKQSTSLNLFIVGGLFLIVMLNIFILGGLYYKCYRTKCKNNATKSDDQRNSICEEKDTKVTDEAVIENGCNFVTILRRSSSKSRDDDSKSGSRKSKKLSRQMSNSTIDAHTKVRDWITQEIVQKYSPRIIKRPRTASIKVPKSSAANIPLDFEKDSTLGRTPTRPVSPTDDTKKVKPTKVSVAIDATPSGRGPSVLMQQPIELTKSLDCPVFSPEVEIPLRRSMTLEDFSPKTVDCKRDLRKSTTSINLKYSPEIEPTIIKIDHSHTKSEPVEDIYGFTSLKHLKTFAPNADVNVTSREEVDVAPLTPEEALQTIKRRNFPKVLPDHPGREALAHKRRSMPAHCLFLPIPENPSLSQPNSPNNRSLLKYPPAPPPRTTSSLDRNNSLPQCVSHSEPMLAEEPPAKEEPELVCNNLYVGPLVAKHKKPELKKLNSQEIYASLKPKTENSEPRPTSPKTIISANADAPIKKLDPKYVIKPTTGRKPSDPGLKHIPRVVVPDNQPQVHHSNEDNLKNAEGVTTASKLPVKVNKPKLQKSHIPTPIKSNSTNKESSSSESTPSEESDTGTVVKRI